MEIGFNLFLLGMGIIIFIMFLMIWSYLLGKYYEKYNSKLKEVRYPA